MKWQIADQVLMLGYPNVKYQSIKNNEKTSVLSFEKEQILSIHLATMIWS